LKEGCENNGDDNASFRHSLSYRFTYNNSNLFENEAFFYSINSYRPSSLALGAQGYYITNDN